MRRYLDTVSVVWEKILLRPLSLDVSLTDRKSEEQQTDEVVSSTIDCQLTSKVHYTDRPEPQHDDLHSTTHLITTYESLTGTNLSCALRLWLSLASSLQYISHDKSDGRVLKEAKATPKPLHLALCTRQAMDTEPRRCGVIHFSS